MHKNTSIFIVFLFLSSLCFSQKDFLYQQKRDVPTVHQKINDSKSKALNQNRPTLYRPLTFRTSPLFQYQNYYLRSTYFLSNYNWMYNSYYHVNNPWLRINQWNRFNSPQHYLFNNQHFFWSVRVRSLQPTTNRYTTTRKTTSKHYQSSKKGRQNGSFNLNSHRPNTAPKTQNSSSTRLKKKY